jgi:fucose permease
LLHFSQVGWPLLALVFVGSSTGGCFPQFLAAVPSESIQAPGVAVSAGKNRAVSELTGGMHAPALLGWSADHQGITVPLFDSLLACPLAAFVALARNATGCDTQAARYFQDHTLKFPLALVHLRIYK